MEIYATEALKHRKSKGFLKVNNEEKNQCFCVSVAILLLKNKLLIKMMPTIGNSAILNCWGRKNHASNNAIV